MSKRGRHVAVGASCGIATMLIFQMTFGVWMLVALTALSAAVGAGVSSGVISPRLAGGGLATFIGVLLGLGVDDTSGLLGIPFGIFGLAISRTPWGCFLGIAGVFVGCAGLAGLEWLSHRWELESSKLLSGLAVFCVLGCPWIGALIGNWIFDRCSGASELPPGETVGHDV